MNRRTKATVVLTARVAASALVVIVCLYLVPSAIDVVKATRIQHTLFPGRLSAELSNAPQASTRDERVAAWLRANKPSIVNAANRFRIDPRAIAGLIAYEALVNVDLSNFNGMAFWSGPGKVHYKQYRFYEGDPMSRQIEDLGLLPKRTMAERARILRSSRWAALYIAGTMRVLANTVQKTSGHDISCDPGALVTLASAWDLSQATHYFAAQKRDRFQFSYNFPGNWVTAHRVWLQETVGDSLQYCVRASARAGAWR